MQQLIETIRSVLVPFIGGTGTLLLILLAALLLLRAARARRARRNRLFAARYNPLVEGWLIGGNRAALDTLVATCPAAHLDIVGRLVIAPMRAFSGEIVERCSVALDALGIVDKWIADLGDSRWWVRSEAASSLGLGRVARAAPALVERLQDEHDDVRSAALDSLGRIRDSASLPAIAALLQTPLRQQRTRVIGALQLFGADAAAVLVEHARAHSTERGSIAEALGLIESGKALDSLLEWSGDDQPAVRAAAWRAIGTIGVDDRTFYFALRALGDPAVEVRAMAARAIGRSGRADSASYLARHLDDEWIVAAHAARALKDLRLAGAPHLQRCAERQGPGAELARQMLWELESRA